jgi:hypothetical protein
VADLATRSLGGKKTKDGETTSIDAGDILVSITSAKPTGGSKVFVAYETSKVEQLRMRIEEFMHLRTHPNLEQVSP